MRTMNNKEFFVELEKLFDRGLTIIKKKNSDYSSGEDPFKNFKNSKLVGVEPERAILIRVSDKLARISNLLDERYTAKVKDEAIEDTIIDMINYLAILHVYIKDSKKSPQ